MSREEINLKKRCKQYGIEPKDYHNMVEKNGGKCPICKREFGVKLKTQIDHKHDRDEDTGAKGKCHKEAVRGVICKNCNLALGHTRDNIRVLASLIAYLLEYRTKGVLKYLISLILISAPLFIFVEAYLEINKNPLLIKQERIK